MLKWVLGEFTCPNGHAVTILAVLTPVAGRDPSAEYRSHQAPRQIVLHRLRIGPSLTGSSPIGYIAHISTQFSRSCHFSCPVLTSNIKRERQVEQEARQLEVNYPTIFLE